ncbi:DNA helicase [Tanacetum coccineum]
MKNRCSEKQVLGYVLIVGITTVEWESGLQKVRQSLFGDESEVEVLRNFNWPPSELITEDGVLPHVPYVRRYRKVRAVALFKGRKVRAVALLKGRWLEVYRDYLRRGAVKFNDSLGRADHAIQIEWDRDFVEARYIGPHEACWRILEFPIHHRDPAVLTLAMHLENMQQIQFRSKDRLQSIVDNLTKKKTTLTKWLDYNRRYTDERHLTCFQEIRTVNDIVYPTNRATCEALGLIGGNQEWIGSLEEAALHASSEELRKLFVQILIFCDVSDPMQDFSVEVHSMCPTFRRKNSVSGISEHEKQHVQRFSSWLLDTGDGNIGEPDETDTKKCSTVHIPEELCIPDNDVAITKLINFINDDQTFKTPAIEDLQKKVIICPKNEMADTINTHVLSLINHERHVYLISDEATPHGNDGGETELLYPNEYLNTLKFAG